MLDEYRALGAAIRRPMRRWWRRNGVWWLAALLVIALADAAIRGLLVPQLEQVSKAASIAGGGIRLASAWGLQPQAWVACACLLVVLARALSAYGWVLAGMHVMRQAAGVLRDVPYPSPTTPRRMYFLLALAAGWPFAVAWIVLNSSILAQAAHFLSGNELSLAEYFRQTSQFTVFPGEPWASLAGMVLAIALLVVVGERDTPVWLWVAAHAWPIAAIWLVNILNMLQRTQTLGLASISFGTLQAPPLEWRFGWTVSAVLTAAMLRLFASGKRGLAYVLLSVMLFALILSSTGDRILFVSSGQQSSGRRNKVKPGSAFTLALGLVRSCGDFPHTVLCDYLPFKQNYSDATGAQSELVKSADGALRFFVPVRKFVIAPSWTSYLVAPLDVLYLAAIIAVLSATCLNAPAPRRRKPQATDTR